MWPSMQHITKDIKQALSCSLEGWTMLFLRLASAMTRDAHGELAGMDYCMMVVALTP